ncbi:glycosyltransferase [Candidatus Omnitrophota bacterium]
MKKILIIAHPFLPFDEGGSVVRVMKFLKYLPEFKWRPVVLTVRDNSVNSPSAWAAFDNLRATIRVHRAFCLNLLSRCKYRSYKTNKAAKRSYPGDLRKEKRFSGRWSRVVHPWFLFPDTAIEWLPFGLIKACSVMQKEGVDIIFSTSPYTTNHIIGLLLKKLFDKPLVVDFRDKWEYSFLKYPTHFHKILNEFLEKKVLMAADKIIVVSEPMRKDILERYQFLSTKKIEVITNGFDPDDFLDVKIKAHDKFTITHAGTFHRPPKVFLKAIKSLINEKPELKNHFRIVFVGSFSADLIRSIKVTQLEDMVEVVPFVAHRRSIGYILNSDLLLVIPGPGIETITGKVFEYIASGKPILALADPGACASLVKETRSGYVVDPCDIDAIKNAVWQSYLSYKSKNLNPDSRTLEISRFHRRNLTKELAGTLNSLL